MTTSASDKQKSTEPVTKTENSETVTKYSRLPETKNSPVRRNNRRPQKSFQGSNVSGPIFQYFMTGDDAQVATTPTKKRPSLGSLSDVGSSFDGELPEQSPRKMTICEAIDEKFSPVNYSACSFTSIGLSPVKHDKDGTVRVPWTLVLEDRNIAFAGDSDTLCKYCGNVRDLDLSHNDLQSWSEIVKILKEMPHLEQLNLGQNKRLSLSYDFSTLVQSQYTNGEQSKAEKPLSNDSPSTESCPGSEVNDPQTEHDVQKKPPVSLPLTLPSAEGLRGHRDDFVHTSLKTLVLINTGAPMDTIAQMLPRLPSLEELHLSLNGYKQIENSVMKIVEPHSRVKTLYFTDNHFSDWRDFAKLGHIFPKTKNLYLACNQLPCIDISFEGVFTSLESLHLGGNKLDSWDCLDRLNELQSLKSLRIHDIPFYANYDPDPTIRRSLCIARLKNVSHLNGSAVSPDNRIDAERFLIRHYLDHHPKPQSHRQHLNDYLGALLFYNQELDCIGALSFYDSKRSIGGAYFSIAASASQPAINSAPISHDSKRSIGGASFLSILYLKQDAKVNSAREKYFELVDKYGQLEKLGEVDLSPIEQICLQLHCSEMEICKEIQVKPSITVLQLKTCVSEIIGIGLKDFNLFYKDAMMEEAFGPVGCFSELKLMSIQLSTAGLCDQSELHARTISRHHNAQRQPSR